MITLELDKETAAKLASVLLGSVQLALDPEMENLMYDLESEGVVPEYDLDRETGALVRRY
ncbi:MAG: hypothetical protein WC322_02930 [Candidatus Paceibacterota bacterium]|jgi:hypothetical protein